MTSWFYVYKDGGEIKAVKSTGNMPKDYPELEDVWCIGTKADSEEEAIKQAIELDSTSSEEDKVL